jgi:hypothetical protein
LVPKLFLKRCLYWLAEDEAAVGPSGKRHLKVRFPIRQVRDVRSSARFKVEHILPVGVRDGNLGFESWALPLLRVDRGIVHLFTPARRIAFGPHAGLSAFVVHPRRALEIGIEPKSIRAVLYIDGTLKKFFARLVPAGVIRNLAIDSARWACNRLGWLAKASSAACGDEDRNTGNYRGAAHTTTT